MDPIDFANGDLGAIHWEGDSIFVEHHETGVAKELVHAMGIEKPQMGGVQQSGCRVGKSPTQELSPHGGVRNVGK